MKALKLSSRPDEKAQLKAQCGVLMDVADRIKKSSDWKPLVDRPDTTKNAQVGQWAANVDASGISGRAYEETVSTENSSLNSFPQNALPEYTRSTSGNSPDSSISFYSQRLPVQGLYRDDHRQALIPHIDLSDGRPRSPCGNNSSNNADVQHKDRNPNAGRKGTDMSLPPSASLPRSHSNTKEQQQPSGTPTVAAEPALPASVAPRLAPPSHIHRLTEPVSTRKRSKKEDIILLKASVVNGFKCPPWNGTPPSTDFIPQNAQELFT